MKLITAIIKPLKRHDVRGPFSAPAQPTRKPSNPGQGTPTA
jgi:hypothetical protein